MAFLRNDRQHHRLHGCLENLNPILMGSVIESHPLVCPAILYRHARQRPALLVEPSFHPITEEREGKINVRDMGSGRGSNATRPYVWIASLASYCAHGPKQAFGASWWKRGNSTKEESRRVSRRDRLALHRFCQQACRRAKVLTPRRSVVTFSSSPISVLQMTMGYISANFCYPFHRV